MIEFKNVTMQFDDFMALSDVSLEIKKGSAFGLLGANGAGKSTMLRLLAGIYKQKSGEVLMDGEPVFDHVENKGKVFFINDETVQYNRFTVNELKNYYKMFYPEFSEELFEKLRASIKLPENKKLSKFSKGMKRQAIMITALACQPQYLLMDEAFDGLDPTMRLIVKRMLVDAMVERDLTTIISSHNLKEIGELCDAVALIYQGKVVFSKDLDDVTGNIHKLQMAFQEEVDKEVFASLDVVHYEKQGSIINMIVKGSEEVISNVIQPMNPLVYDRIPLTLEEIFIYEMEGLGYEYSRTE